VYCDESSQIRWDWSEKFEVKKYIEDNGCEGTETEGKNIEEREVIDNVFNNWGLVQIDKILLVRKL
jgi:hypothetical protein